MLLFLGHSVYLSRQDDLISCKVLEAGLPACDHKLCQKIYFYLRRLSSSFHNGFKVMDKQSGESKEQEVMVKE